MLAIKLRCFSSLSKIDVRTTSNSIGPLTISSGNLTATYFTGLTINQGDQLALAFSVSGSAVVSPGIQWYNV